MAAKEQTREKVPNYYFCCLLLWLFRYPTGYFWDLPVLQYMWGHWWLVGLGFGKVDVSNLRIITWYAWYYRYNLGKCGPLRKYIRSTNNLLWLGSLDPIKKGIDLNTPSFSPWTKSSHRTKGGALSWSTQPHAGHTQTPKKQKQINTTAYAGRISVINMAAMWAFWYAQMCRDR